jgi:hypothetical protein
MSWTVPKTWTTGEVLTKADLDTYLRDNSNFLKTNIALEAAVELTIASGTVTKTQGCHSIDTESDAATDDLDTINGGSEGDVIFIRPASGSRTVIIKHGSGNIRVPGAVDISLVDADDGIVLVFNGSNWTVVGGPDHSNANDPTVDEKAALSGTSGMPSAANKYVTDADSRNTDARTPAAHNHDSDYLNKDNTSVYVPDADYEPATKKYVDDHSGGNGFSFDGGVITDSNNTCIVFDLGGVT